MRMSSSGERSGMGKACEECSRRCSLLHGKGNASFFKIMFGERFSEFLFIPPKFVPMITAGVVNEGTFLKDTNGGQWRVECAQVEGSLALGKGWGDFVKHHDLVLGDLVVFHLVQSHFEVKMYGRTACEKLINVPEMVHGGKNKCPATEKLQAQQQSKVVKEKSFQESKNKRCSEKSFRIPAAKQVVMGHGLNPIETGTKCQRNERSARAPIVIDLEMEDDDPKAASNVEKPKAHKMEGGKSQNIHISRNEKNKRASDVELQQTMSKCPKKEKLDEVGRNKNGISLISQQQHLFDGECSRDAEMGKAASDAAIKNLASAGGNRKGKFERWEVLQKKLQRKSGGNQSELRVVTNKRGSCGKHKDTVAGKLDNVNLLERSRKLVTGFDTENNLSKRFSIPSTAKELACKDAKTGKRLSGDEVELMQMKDENEMAAMAVLKSEPPCLSNRLPTPISAQISCVVPDETRTHLDLPAPLPVRGAGSLCLQKRLVILKDPTTRVWPVIYHRISTTKASLKCGWGAFADAHNIRPGDECIFSIESCNEGVYVVHIIRHHVG